MREELAVGSGTSPGLLMELSHSWQEDAAGPTYFSTCDNGQPKSLLRKILLQEAAALISFPRDGAASGTCPHAGRTSDLKQLSLQVVVLVPPQLLVLSFHLPLALLPSPSPHHPRMNTSLRPCALPHHILPTQPFPPGEETSWRRRKRVTSLDEPTGEGCQLVQTVASLFSTHSACTPCRAALQEGPPSFPGAWEHSPAQDLDFTIFSRRMMMASKWEMSPRMRNTFMVSGGSSGVKGVGPFLGREDVGSLDRANTLLQVSFPFSPSMEPSLLAEKSSGSPLP